MDQWVELSRITISGPMTRKEDLLLLSRPYEASEGEEVCDMTSHLIVCMQPVNTFLFVPFVSLLLLHHFSFFLNLLFFFLRWGMIIQHFSRATICDPAEGTGQFPVHMVVTDALCARTQEPEFKFPNFSCRALCTLLRGGDYSPLWYILIHAWWKIKSWPLADAIT